jgi:hypothetical protein
MVLVSGNLGPKGDPQTLLRKVLMLETLNTAMLKAEQRKLAFGVRRKKADYDPGALFKDVVKVGGGGEGGGGEGVGRKGGGGGEGRDGPECICSLHFGGVYCVMEPGRRFTGHLRAGEASKQPTA